MDKNLILKHYTVLSHKNATEIRLFGKTSIDDKIHIVHNSDEFVNVIMRFTEDNVGVGVHERGLRGIDDDSVTNMNFIVIDIDTVDDFIIDECERKFKENKLFYCAKVFTGKKGYHYYFKIKELEGNMEIKECLANCKYYFVETLKLPVDGKCFNASRVFRVWGTMNKGNLVELRDFNDSSAIIDTKEQIPQRPIDSENLNIVSKDKHYNNQVVDDFPLFDALYKDPSILPIIENSNFNDAIVKNIAAYTQKKGIKDMKPWFELLKRKNHSVSEFIGWVKKPRYFNPFEVIANVREFYPALYKQYCEKMRQLPSHVLTYIEDDEKKWEQLKHEYIGTNSFIINRQFKTESNIVLGKENKLVMKIAKIYKNIEDPNLYFKLYFDNPLFEKGLPKAKKEEMKLEYVGEINASFYIYQAVDKDISYSIFSEEKLFNGRYKLYGTLVKFSDFFTFGSHAKAQSYSYVLFLHSYERKDVRFLSLDDMYSKVKVTGDDFYRYMLTESENVNVPIHYKTNEFWKKVYTSFVFSGSMNKGEKLNLVVMGPTGTGKTPHLRAIGEKFNEGKYYSGTTLSIPGMTISFWGDIPRPGALLECLRICCIDEFFKIFNKLEDISQVTAMNDYLDNQRVSATSGKSSILVKSSCQVFAVTNPIRRSMKNIGVRKLMSLFDMFDFVDADFWGRFMVVNQINEDTEWVLDQNNHEYNVLVSEMNSELFVSIYDYFKDYKEVMKAMDVKRLNQIVKSITVPEVIESVYKKMCNRIPILLFDGMIKWKMFCNKYTSPVIEENDYNDFYVFWKEIVTRWMYGETGYDLSNKFSSSEQDVLMKIKEKSTIGISYDDFNEICKTNGVDFKDFRHRLTDVNMIKLNSEKRRIVYNKEIEQIEEIMNMDKDLLDFTGK